MTPPHELGWEPHAGGNFRAVVGKALWGDKAAEVGEGGAHADKLETVLIVELHQNHVKEEYNEGFFDIDKDFLDNFFDDEQGL